MNQAIKERWVEALRSGEYNQTRGRLRDDAGYCCLGVLCDIVAPEQWDVSTLSYAHSHSGIGDIPASWVTDKAELPRFLTKQPNVHVISELAGKNDEGQSFTQIAAWIEENL